MYLFQDDPGDVVDGEMGFLDLVSLPNPARDSPLLTRRRLRARVGRGRRRLPRLKEEGREVEGERLRERG